MLRGIVLGAGGALGVMSQTEQLNDVPRSVLRAALSGYDKISVNHSNPSALSTLAKTESPVNDELAKVSTELKQLRLEQQQIANKPVIIYGQTSNGFYYKVLLVSSVSIVVLYYYGFPFSKIMYATRANLKEAVETLESNISTVGSKLQQAKTELLVKLGLVEENLNTELKTLSEAINTVSDELNENMADIQDQLNRIEKTSNKLENKTESISGLLQMLDTKFEVSRTEVRKLGYPIVLLLKSVLSLEVGDNNSRDEMREFLQNYETERILAESPAQERSVGLSGRLRERLGKGLSLLSLKSYSEEVKD